MILILDTSILIELEKGNKEIIEKLDELRKTYPAPAKIAFISYFEFLYGLKDRSIKNKDKSIAFLEKFDVIQTTKKTADSLIGLKRKYELPLADLLIAAQTIENDGLLVTKDKDFNIIQEVEKTVMS